MTPRWSTPRAAAAPIIAGRALPISDASVHAATGRDWAAWVAALNKAGAAAMDHREIARLVHEHFGIPGWWSQMVTVGYEQATGRRGKQQRPDGFSVSASKTIAVPVEYIFAAWEDVAMRARWLPVPVTIRKASPYKSMRVTWRDGKTILAVGFLAKGPSKGQVAVEHGKLKSRAEAARTQAFWRRSLEGLRAILER